MRTPKSATSPHKPQPLDIFLYSCSHHKIEQYCEELERHLIPLRRQGLIVIQQSHRIPVGLVKKDVLMSCINTADMLVFPLSAWLFDSDEYWDIMDYAKQLCDQGKVRLVPVLASPADSAATYLGGLQVLPRGKKSLFQLSSRDREAAFAEIAENIRGVIKDLQACVQPGEIVAVGMEVHEQVNDPAFYKERGDFFVQHQEYDKAVVAYSKAISLDPYFADAYTARAELLKILATLNYEKLQQISDLFDNTQEGLE